MDHFFFVFPTPSAADDDEHRFRREDNFKKRRKDGEKAAGEKMWLTAEPMIHSDCQNHHRGEKVRASHILIMHERSRRKSKDPDGSSISATTRDAAVARLQALRDSILSREARFEDVSARHSDCSSAKCGGDLGHFGRGRMQKPFEEAVFAPKVGEISDTVDTDNGVHIILRTE